MNSATIIAIVILAAIIFLAVRYIYKEKKKGTRCIGCPAAGNCPHKNMDHNSHYNCEH